MQEPSEKQSTDTKLRATLRIEFCIDGTLRRTIDPSRWDDAPEDEEELPDYVEQLLKESNYNWQPRLGVTLESKEETYYPDQVLSARAKRQFDYLLDNFDAAVRSLVSRLVNLEFTVLEAYDEAPNFGSDFREAAIKLILAETEKDLKKRLPKGRGRTPFKDSYHYIDDKYEFVESCLEELKRLSEEKLKLYKKDLAESMYPRNSNPEKAFSNALNKFELSWNELIKEHKGEGNIIHTLFTKELHRFRRRYNDVGTPLSQILGEKQ